MAGVRAATKVVEATIVATIGKAAIQEPLASAGIRISSNKTPNTSLGWTEITTREEGTARVRVAQTRVVSVGDPSSPISSPCSNKIMEVAVSPGAADKGSSTTTATTNLSSIQTSG